MVLSYLSHLRFTINFMEGGLSIDEKVIIINETSTKYFVASVTHTDGESYKQTTEVF